MAPARRRQIGIVALILFLALSSLLVWNHSAPEPAYNGKPLSFWTGTDRFISSARFGRSLPLELSSESTTAVRAIGTNSFPLLLRWIAYPHGFRERILDSVVSTRTPALLKRLLIPFIPKSYRPTSAILAFRALGPDAEISIHGLVKLLDNPINAHSVVVALCGIGITAVPALTNAISETPDGFIRGLIIHALLHGVTPELESAISPVLVETLRHDAQASNRAAAAEILATFTSSTNEPVLSALAIAIRDHDAVVQLNAMNAFQNFGANAARAQPILEEALRDPNYRIRSNAKRAIELIQPKP
jgi:hypothetical protein